MSIVDRTCVLADMSTPGPGLVASAAVRRLHRGDPVDCRLRLLRREGKEGDLVGSGLDRLYDVDKNNFGPRIGFAYSINKEKTLIMRGGYGLLYTLDGVDNNETWLQTVVIFPSVDALDEFKLQTSTYSAEFGRAASQVNVVTKSGTNDFRGTAFYFFRNETYGADVPRL